jgi:inward rectifier potassium channel
LFGLNEAQLLDANAEILVLLKGIDEATEQLVHARRSYISEEVVWHAKFSPMMGRTTDLVSMEVHTRKISDYRKLDI